MKYTLLSACVFCGVNALAQNDDAKRLDIGAEFTTELQATNKGDYNNANLLRLNASLAVSRSISIEAASLSTYMTASESIGGDLQTFSNLDAGNIAFALSVCNVAWQINNHHTLYAGIRNMNEDYFTSSVTSFFTNSSCGIYPTISANYPIANYPVASVGMHYRYDSNPIKVQASLYNGTGYNRFTGRENVFRLCPKDDGVFGLAQIEYNHNGSSYFLGNSLYYNNRTSITPWFYAEQHLCNNLSMLAGYSHAFSSEAECKDFAGLGFHYQQKKCELGVFTDYARFANAREFATELTFKYNATENICIQPILHFSSTSFDNSKTSAHSIASLRIGVSL